MKLTDAACRHAKGKAVPYKLSDGMSMYLLVKPNGSRLWQMSYRFGDKQKTLSFGMYPMVSLADARERRENARAQLSANTDPGQVVKAAVQVVRAAKVKKENIKRNTFEALARAWHENSKGAWVEAHSERVMARMVRDVLPAIGAKDITDIEPAEILAVLRKVEARGAIDITKRLRQSIGAVFRFAIAEGKAKANPAAELADALKPKPKVKHFASLKAREIAPFLAALKVFDGQDQTRLAILFTLHTFVRTNEIRFAQWTEFEDLAGKAPIWRIPEDRMKMGREHIVPLTPAVVKILAGLKAIAGESPYVVPAGGKLGVISENTMLFGIYRMGYHSRLTVHGFRGTASTILNEKGFPSDHIERQLAHVESNKIRAAYNSAEWLPARRKMMMFWSDFLDKQAKVAA